MGSMEQDGIQPVHGGVAYSFNLNQEDMIGSGNAQVISGYSPLDLNQNGGAKRKSKRVSKKSKRVSKKSKKSKKSKSKSLKRSKYSKKRKSSSKKKSRRKSLKSRSSFIKKTRGKK